MVTELFGDADRLANDPLLERLRLATAGAYDVAAELGRGGMAVVYGGVDRKLERRVAIKVMDPRLSMTQGMAARFLQEARIAARLQHPNIIVVHDVRQSEEIIFFVMSLIDGVGVDELCRQSQPVPIDQIRWILLQATRALAYAHSEGIVHRDIKPANILLNLKGDVILTDFGIAKALGDTGLTQSGTQIGTPMYMSPEQFSSAPVGPASDQYALGVTAYQMIAGKPPFSGDLYQLIAAHGGKNPVPLQELSPDCPPFLANAVMRMLEKRPEDRWPSLEDLQDVFGANMAMDGGTARRNLAAAVRAMRPGAAVSGWASDPGRVATPSSGPQRTESFVVTISPPGATVFVSGSLELRASVALESGQSMPGAGVLWSSSNDAVLVVQPNGMVTGMAPGTAVVRASVNGGSSEATIRVEAAPIARLSMTGPSLTMRVGDVLRPDVMAMDVNGVARSDVTLAWISRSPAVVDLDEPGVLRAVSPGMAILDVSTGNVRRSIDVIVSRRPVTRLRIVPIARALSLGDAEALTVESFDDLGSRVEATPVRWTSSAPSVIHVDSTGRALAIGSGVARITVAADEATDTIELEALEPPVGSVQLTVSENQLELGDEVSYALRVKDVRGASRSTAGVRVWSADPRIVQVDDATQRAVAMSVGETTLYAAADGVDAKGEARVRVTDVMVASLEVFPGTLDLEVGAVAALNLQGLDRRGRHVMVAPQWESDTTACAVVEGNGIVRGLALGSCRIRAYMTNADGSVAEATVAVRVRRSSIARLTINAERSMLEVGETLTLRATTFDAMDEEVADATPAWRSTQPDIARVDSSGQVVALAPGRATILVELEGKSGQLALMVAPSSIVSVDIAPVSTDVLVGVPLALSVNALDRNGQAVAPSVRWALEPADAGTITANGTVTPTRAGTLRVRASLIVPTDATGILSARNALEALLDLKARAPKPVSIAFAKPSLTLAVGKSARVDVRALAEGDVALPAKSVTWSSSDPALVQVDATGEVRGVAIGDAQVIASAGDVTSRLSVRVAAPSVATSPSRLLAMAGGAVAVVAIAWMAWPKGSGSSQPESTVAPAVPTLPEPPKVVIADSSRVAAASTPATPTLESPASALRSAPPKVDAPVKAPALKPDTRTVPTTSAKPAPSPTVTTAPTTAPTKSPPPSTPVQTPPAQSPAAPTPTPPPAVVEAPASKPAAAPVVTYEAPSLGDVRGFADQIARQVRSGTLRPSPDLLQFFNDGADHKVEIRSAPAMTEPEQGHVRTQFELSLTRFSAGGLKENRFVIVRIDVAKRNGTAELVDKSFGPLTKSSSR